MKYKIIFKFKICLLIVGVGFGLSACKKGTVHDEPSNPPVLPPAGSQWMRVNTLPADSITALEIFNNVIYAASATSGKIYESADGGSNWLATAPIGSKVHVSAIVVFNGKIYAGTVAGDVYSSADNGKTWVDEGGLTKAATSFTVWNDNLYCSSFDNGGKGILRLNIAGNKWEPFISGFTGQNNIVRASKLMVADNYLVAATSDVFAVYDAGQQVWHTKNYVDSTKTIYKHARFPNYVVDMVYSQGSILAQIYIGNNDQESILRTDDGGANLYLDTIGLKADTDLDKYTIRGLLVVGKKTYSVINQEKGAVGVWIQSRDKTAALGTTWAGNDEFLPGVLAYTMRWLNNVFFLATDKGLYYKHS